MQSECRVDAEGFRGHQVLRVRQSDRDPVTVAEFSSAAPIPDPLGLCRLYGDTRIGDASVVAAPLQRLTVSEDGSTVIFEVTDDHSFFPFTDVSPEQEGMFLVRADGRGLRRLGPASREASFRIAPSRTGGFDSSTYTQMPFSPNGRMIAFTDVGPGPAGEDAAQIVVLDVATGQRTQVTRLPAGSTPDPSYAVTCCPTFVDDETVLFHTFTDLSGGSNPEGVSFAYTVKINGTQLRRVAMPVAVPGSRVVPTFRTTGLGANVVDLNLPGTALNPIPGANVNPISEVFFFDGRNLLQLTNFYRTDTLSAFLSVDGRRGFFAASGDPLGTNPLHGCQLFSIDVLGAHLRQLTRFSTGAPSRFGCFTASSNECTARDALQGPVTRTVVFSSTCDPLGNNHHGEQLFAMRPDGSGLRQLTDAAGITIAPDGSVRVEQPGPFAYSTAVR